MSKIPIDFLIDLFGEDILENEGYLTYGKPSSILRDIAKKYNMEIGYINISKEELDKKIDALIEVVFSLKFPQSKSGGTNTFKPNKVDFKRKLIGFYNKYPISDYPIEKVTDKIVKYVNKCYYNPSEYNTSLKYYVLKNGYSMLADDCDNSEEDVIKLTNNSLRLI